MKPGATSSERHSQIAREETTRERHSQVAREETTRERPLAATCRGRSTYICLAEFMFSQGPFGVYRIDKNKKVDANSFLVNRFWNTYKSLLH